jgi:hypothetical protein
MTNSNAPTRTVSNVVLEPDMLPDLGTVDGDLIRASSSTIILGYDREPALHENLHCLKTRSVYHVLD